MSQRPNIRVVCHQAVAHKSNRANKIFKIVNKGRNSRLKLDSMSSDKLAFCSLLIAALYSSREPAISSETVEDACKCDLLIGNLDVESKELELLLLG